MLDGIQMVAMVLLVLQGVGVGAAEEIELFVVISRWFGVCVHLCV